MKRSLYIGMAAAAVTTLGILALAQAKEHGDEVSRFPTAKVSMVDAVAMAEQAAGGRAVKAELESTKQGAAYDIEIIKSGVMHDVRIDANTLAVLRNEIDKPDGKGDDDEEDDDDHDPVD